MIRKLLILLFCLTLILPAAAQVVRNDTKIRVSIGIANNLSSTLNDLTNALEVATEQNGLLLPVNNFNRHLQLNAEYEIDISKNMTMALAFEYDQERLSNSSVDNANNIFQGINYEIIYFGFSTSILHYFPVFEVDLGQAKLFAGAGAEAFYGNADMSFQFDQRPLKLQVVRFTKFGWGFGGRVFGGFELPFMPSVFLQVRAGVSFRGAANLKGEVKSTREDPIDPKLFAGFNEYNFGSLWMNLGLAYYF